MNVLVIAPHPDDEAIGCGGSLCLHAVRGDRITVVFLTSGELGLKNLPSERARATREAEARDSAKILGVTSLHFLRQPDWLVGDDIQSAATALRPLLNEIEPELIYVPHPNDAHPDHEAALPVLLAALNQAGRCRPRMLGYEVWSPLAEPDVVRDISSVMPRKLRALSAHRSQLSEFDYVGVVRELNARRGACNGAAEYAEAFKAL